jgi:hypothetical protein
MRQSISSPYPISDFIEWQTSKQLLIAPKFQRRDVWIPKAKSYLIDTILRGMPIPPLFIRLKTDPSTRRTMREVVDGQQRLRAVLGFIEGQFTVMNVHNDQYGGMTYADLPQTVQKEFLGYKFSVNLLEDVSDGEVLSIFARMNTYTVKLNSQELRNANYFGAFKQLVYGLAHDHFAFWSSNAILKDKDIARMKDAEFVSTLVVTMLAGIRQTKSRDLEDYYSEYDDNLPPGKDIAAQFNHVIDIIGDMFGSNLKKTTFRRIPLFYSLFGLIYDARFGLPRSTHRRVRLDAAKIRLAGKRLLKVSTTMTSEKPPRQYNEFIEATERSTADVGKRELRHNFLWNNVITGL